MLAFKCVYKNLDGCVNALSNELVTFSAACKSPIHARARPFASKVKNREN